ncbi:hypothetical protein [Marinilabilia salmonicolor]|uniref:hypothetical protein n=1 Tax=Marinilabilia salmonicolor TaxID=989 RepID=UPI00046A2557|nr:hypothetical protein [Marinilabilia salmonicolor]
MKAYEDFTVTQKFEFAASPKLDFYAGGTYYQKDMFRQQAVADYGYYYQDEAYGAGANTCWMAEIIFLLIITTIIFFITIGTIMMMWMGIF